MTRLLLAQSVPPVRVYMDKHSSPSFKQQSNGRTWLNWRRELGDVTGDQLDVNMPNSQLPPWCLSHRLLYRITCHATLKFFIWLDAALYVMLHFMLNSPHYAYSMQDNVLRPAPNRLHSVTLCERTVGNCLQSFIHWWSRSSWCMSFELWKLLSLVKLLQHICREVTNYWTSKSSHVR